MTRESLPVAPHPHIKTLPPVSKQLFIYSYKYDKSLSFEPKTSKTITSRVFILLIAFLRSFLAKVDNPRVI